MKKITTSQKLSILLLVIFVFSILATLNLVYTDFIEGNICPKIANIPACQIILVCFITPFLVHIFKWKPIYYFIGTGLAFSIALYGTIMQVLNYVSCPKTSSDVPMCFISLGIFSALITIKITLNKLNYEK